MYFVAECDDKIRVAAMVSTSRFGGNRSGGARFVQEGFSHQGQRGGGDLTAVEKIVAAASSNS